MTYQEIAARPSAFRHLPSGYWKRTEGWTRQPRRCSAGPRSRARKRNAPAIRLFAKRPEGNPDDLAD